MRQLDGPLESPVFDAGMSRQHAIHPGFEKRFHSFSLLAGLRFVYCFEREYQRMQLSVDSGKISASNWSASASGMGS